MWLAHVVTAAVVMVAAGTAQDNQYSFECPLPGNPPLATESACAEHSACVWTDGQCHLAGNRQQGYVYAADPVDTARGFQATVTKANASSTMFGGDVGILLYEVIHHEAYHVQIKLSDPSTARYEVPVPVHLPPVPAEDPLYTVRRGRAGEPLVMGVVRASNGNHIYHQVGPLTFEDQFLEFSVGLSSPHLYGLGENPHTTLARIFEPRTTYPMFARDQPIDVTQSSHYGTYPYFVSVEDAAGNTHSVLLRNSNAMEYSTFLMTDGTPCITFRSTGGIIDLHIFAGPSPEAVNTQYTSLVGKPLLPPYWSLGFHLSRWGYNSTDGVRQVRARMEAAGIPQDVQVFDIDYMDARRDFTFDPVHFADLPALLGELRSDNIRSVIILDPAIPMAAEPYPPFVAGVAADAFIKWPTDMVPTNQSPQAKDYIVGNVWPSEPTVFPDFLNPATKTWWADEIVRFREQLLFDGLWIDMNEPANFNTNGDPDNSLLCPENPLDNPPYPTKVCSLSNNLSGLLSDKTLCMASVQNDGNKQMSHYDVHNLYGHSESVATYEALQSALPGQRPFVLSRSSYPGSGSYAIHWLGDNSATWQQMAMSVIGMIEFNMFGIPMVGADLCGFSGHPSEELCARWMELGAFSPFSRNHNAIGEADQDPAAWPLVAEISARVLATRYKYIPYLYTLMHDAHMYGNSVLRPLFNVFPSDLRVRSVSDQFMWGDGLMIDPVLTEGAVERSVYFPKGLWYGLISESLEVSSGPLTVSVAAPLETIPVYVRGGSILPFQEPALTTYESRLNDFGLLVALDEEQFASGHVFWDNGVQEHVMSETYLGDVIMAQDELSLTVRYNRTAAAGVNLASVKFMGYPAAPLFISVNGHQVYDFNYDESTQLLLLHTNLPLSDDLHISFANQYS